MPAAKLTAIAALMMVAQAADALAFQPPPPAPPVPRMAERLASSRSPLANLISPDDYPDAAMEALEQGAVTVELGVTPEGRVGTCRIVRSSGSVSLDATTCRVLSRRARFQPARDSAGHAVSGRVEHRIGWELDSSLPFESLAAISIARTDPAGAILYCYDHTLIKWCADPQFDFGAATLALAGAVPPSSEFIRTMSFTPERRPSAKLAAASRTGDRMLFSGSARVALSPNGKVTNCVETDRAGGANGALCTLARTWLFRIHLHDRETRSGVWRITLASRPLATPHGAARP